MVLRIESAAPPIKVDAWLRGEPLTNFQSGKVYLLEFWATGCGPCVAAIPHLMELLEKYQDSGFEVVGVAASEEGPTAQEARTRLDAWLTEMFQNPTYRIAFDYTGKMNRLWMQASSRRLRRRTQSRGHGRASCRPLLHRLRSLRPRLGRTAVSQARNLAIGASDQFPSVPSTDMRTAAKEVFAVEFDRFLEQAHGVAQPKKLLDLVCAFALNCACPWIAYG